MLRYKRILFKISGSIAAFKACQVISHLVKNGAEIRIAATPAALEFVGKATLEGLTQNSILTSVFDEGRMMDHINLDRWAEATVLCPATANTINKLAAGIGDDIVSTLFLAHDFSKPYYLIPAMNEKMWQHPATVKSVEFLKQIGVKVLGPTSGSLACGEFGEGRMIDPDEVIRELTLKGSCPRVLVTAGGTSEPIDSVRSITNTSTGTTAAAISDELIRRGAEVVYLKAMSAKGPHNSCEIKEFKTFKDLRDLLFSQLSLNDFDFVIHAAAVSDFSVKNTLSHKMESQGNVTVELQPNPKLINGIKEHSKNKKVKLIGFKLADDEGACATPPTVKKLIEKSDANWVVFNKISDVSDSKHLGKIFSKNGLKSSFSSNKDLATQIGEIVTGEQL